MKRELPRAKVVEELTRQFERHMAKNGATWSEVVEAFALVIYREGKAMERRKWR
jgi:hypothetical protein